MKVLIIPEDQELDQYIVKPVVEALFQDLGRAAKVMVLPEPRLRGASQALDPELIAGIVEARPMIDLFLLVVDRDCDRERNSAKATARESEHADKLIACVAVEELEVWMMALHTGHLDAPFSKVRAHCDSKEPTRTRCSRSSAIPVRETDGNTRCVRSPGPSTGFARAVPRYASCESASRSGSRRARTPDALAGRCPPARHVRPPAT